MATIFVTVVVSDIAAVLSVPFDRIKVYRSTTGEGGVYAEITDASTRIPLAAGKQIYEYIDSAGDETYYYKTSYYNSSTTAESSLSDAVLGESDPALDILTPQELKDYYLFGLDLTNDDGDPYPDPLYRFYISYGVDRVEKELDINLLTRSFTERHDYYRQDYLRYVQLKTLELPVLSVESVKIILAEQTVATFQSEWIHPYKPAGHVHILPGLDALNTVLLGQTGSWLHLLAGYADFIPDAFEVAYSAGFLSIPPVLKELVGKFAAFGPLNIAGDLLGGAGIASQSIGLDGLSQSFNTTSSSTSAGYGARLIQYEKEIKALVPKLRSYYHPVSLEVV
jgi:hypothetical protein